ncbi:MAG: sigma-70 family RNA polymerase sigma factor [Planctomycetes bacterium]|nr:sigma-70 family RNA polymerase sigma factor [Planctomycetota bacterium]
MPMPSAIPTPHSLLERLRQQPDADSWCRFVELYTPLLYQFSVKLGLTKPRAEDLVQEVFAILVRELPRFEYDPSRSFRAWLWTIFRNKSHEFRRRFDPLAGANPAPQTLIDPNPISDLEEAEFNRYLVHRAMQIMKAEFAETTWRACLACVVEEQAPEDVAEELGITKEAVYQAKSRVLRRLRQELDGMVD